MGTSRRSREHAQSTGKETILGELSDIWTRTEKAKLWVEKRFSEKEMVQFYRSAEAEWKKDPLSSDRDDYWSIVCDITRQDIKTGEE